MGFKVTIIFVMGMLSCTVFDQRVDKGLGSSWVWDGLAHVGEFTIGACLHYGARDLVEAL